MQRKKFQFSSIMIDSNPQAFFLALKETLLMELSMVKKEIKQQDFEVVMQLIAKLDELNYNKAKDVSVSIVAIEKLINLTIDKLAKINQLKFNILKNIIHDASVLLYYHHYGIQNLPDPAGSKLTTNSPSQFDLTQGVPQHMINAMLADPQFCLFYVTGASANPYDHALIFLGAAGFLHIDGLTDYPKHLTIQEFNKYLNTQNKSVIDCQVIAAPHVNDMIIGVCETTQSRYFWGGIKHNCIDFCHEVFKQGGYDAERRPEYQSITLSLPSEYLKKTPLDELRPDKKLMRDVRRNFSEAILLNKDIRNLDILSDLLPDEVIKLIRYILQNPDKMIASQKAILTANAVYQSKNFSQQQLIVLSKQHIVEALAKLKTQVEGRYKILFTADRLPLITELLSPRHVEEVFTGELLKLHGIDPALARPSSTRNSFKTHNLNSSSALDEQSSPLQQLNILAPQLTPKAQGSFDAAINQAEESAKPKNSQKK